MQIGHKELNLVYAGEDLKPHDSSIFLAGPTPRSDDVKSWRPEAIEVIKTFGIINTVYVPEARDGKAWPDYDDNFEWELSALERASNILFWVPRDMETMPALTTNVEYGYWMAESPEKCFLGYPTDCPDVRKNRYLAKLYKRKTEDDPCHTLEELVAKIIKFELS